MPAEPRSLPPRPSARSPAAPWWGPVALDRGPRQLQVGPLRLRLHRGRKDLRVETGYAADPHDVTVRPPEPADDSPLGAQAAVRRFALDEGSATVQLSPSLVDLAVVTRPEHDFTILPGDEAVIFVGTPLLLRLDVTGPEMPEQRLLEVPLAPLRQTWFGTAEEGQLAYASRTYCRLSIDELPYSPHRAYTAVRLKNVATTPLDLERLLIPVVNLSLGVDDTGRLWTDDLHLVRTAGDPYAPLEPAHGRWQKRREDVEILAEPRAPLGGPSLLRLLAPMF